jgi:hypothetical protein
MLNSSTIMRTSAGYGTAMTCEAHDAALPCCAMLAGFCIPRQAWQLQGAYAVQCPANTYLQTYFNGKQVW